MKIRWQKKDLFRYRQNLIEIWINKIDVEVFEVKGVGQR